MTSEDHQLPLTTRILYASGSLGSQVLTQTLTVWVFFFYAAEGAEDRDPLGPVLWVGFALVAGRVVDAVTDPIIGYISDITRSRWGRRGPYILAGGPFMALAFVMLWFPPAADGSSWVNVAWLAGVLQLYFLGVTVVGAPYTGIFPELAVGARDRVSISAWQLVFGLVGAGIALIATGPIIDLVGFGAMGVLIAVIGLLPRYIGLWGVRGKLHYRPPRVTRAESLPALVRALRSMLRNRSFLVLVGSLVCFQGAQLMLTQAVPFFVVEILGHSAGMQAPVTASFFVAAMLMIPVIVRSTYRFGKRHVYGACLLGGALTLPLLFFAGFLPAIPELVQVVVIIALIGFPLSGAFILPDTLLADVVDEDSSRTETRYEAMFFSSRATLEKLGQALATGLFSVLLALFGATAAEPLGVRLIGPVSAVLMLVGWALFFAWYRVPEQPARMPADA
ncbi:MAG: MFS transporter [Dehalococcoidia bacterium]|nr:MFS transporter [Dehalococcoidia bacterium]